METGCRDKSKALLFFIGGLQAIAELVHLDYMAHGQRNESCILVRRYSGMALTNLTFGDGNNKATLCSMRDFMNSLIAQLDSRSEDLKQVTASVLRNLSWRADSKSRVALREAGGVLSLTRCMMSLEKEATLKSVLSALWNLSAHCTENKIQICSIYGSLAFLVSTLTYRSHSKTLAIVENGGGVLRNISSYVATHEEYRAILRRHSCLEILLQQLKSPSLTVVSNACGTLWNLSARCPQDQRRLWELGAVGMLRNLVNSKHKMISLGSSAALKNLLTAQQQQQYVECRPIESSGDGSQPCSIVSDDALAVGPKGQQHHKDNNSTSLHSDDDSAQTVTYLDSNNSITSGSCFHSESKCILSERRPSSLSGYLPKTQGPVLLARKARNLQEQFVTCEDAKNLSELCDNIEASPKASPGTQSVKKVHFWLHQRALAQHLPDANQLALPASGLILSYRHRYLKTKKTLQQSITSDTELTPVVECKPLVSARATKSIPRPQSASPVSLSRRNSNKKNNFDLTAPSSEKSPSASLRRNYSSKHLNQLKAVETEDDSSIVSDLGGVQPPSYINEQRSMTSSCGSLELGERSPLKKLLFKDRSCVNADEWSPKSCDNLHSVMPPSGLNSAECLSLQSSTNSEILLNANPPSFLDDLSTRQEASFDNRTHDIEVHNRNRETQVPPFIAVATSQDCSKGRENDGDVDQLNTKSAKNYQVQQRRSAMQTMHQVPHLHSKPSNGLVAHLLDDPTEIGSDAFLSDTEGEDLPYDSTADYYTCLQSSETLRASLHFQSCFSGHTQDATGYSSDNLTTFENTLTFDVSPKKSTAYQNSRADLTYDSTLIYKTELQLQQETRKQKESELKTNDMVVPRDPADDDCSVVSSVDDATYDISSPQTPTEDRAKLVKPIFFGDAPVISGQTIKQQATVVTGKNSSQISHKKNIAPSVSIRQTRASALRASKASQGSEFERVERGACSNSSSPTRLPVVSTRLSSPANRRPLPRTASSFVAATRITPMGGRVLQVNSPLASRATGPSLRTTLNLADNMRPPNTQRMTSFLSTSGTNQYNENQPPGAAKPSLTKQGTFTKDSGELLMKPTTTPPVPNARTVVPNNKASSVPQQTNRAIFMTTVAYRRVPTKMHKSTSVSTNMTMTRSLQPSLNRTQSDSSQTTNANSSAAQTKEPLQRLSLAMRTTAASRARAAAIAHSRMQSGHAQRIALTRRNTSSDRQFCQQQQQQQQTSNNLNNNQQLIQNDNDNLQTTMSNNSGLLRSSTYEKINEVGLSPFEDKNHNEQLRSPMTTSEPVRPIGFGSTGQRITNSPKGQQDTGNKSCFLKRSILVSGNCVTNSSISLIDVPRSISGLKSPCDTTVRTVHSPGSSSASRAAIVTPFNYRPRSTPTTPNGSKIPIICSDGSASGELLGRKNSINTTPDEEGYIVARAKLVTTV
ncbi:hypothetical protein BIW11_10769 [Tropilaelaps mercedesae]|uniref:Adenomatous polyposis coli protein-like n=1 Tax=Tropilaelaps mercedesae TaxID=418985 RepID=A0A1V9XEG5_9ACAR|nr:hypothetical protein BIW11_10769 [Tropilaelaps mercedesae]